MCDAPQSLTHVPEDQTHTVGSRLETNAATLARQRARCPVCSGGPDDESLVTLVVTAG